MKRPIIAVAVGVAAAVLAVAGWARPASAHAELDRTDPLSGSVLGRSPGLVTMTFTEPVEISLGSVRVYDGGGRRVDVGNPYHPNGSAVSIGENLRATLHEGGYIVAWRVISADSHPVHGAFTFQIGSDAGAASAAADAAGLSRRARGSRSVGAVFWAVRALGLAAMAVLLGGTAVVIGAWPAGRSHPSLRALLLGAWVAAGVTTVLAIGLQGAYGDGLGLVTMVKPSVISAVLRPQTAGPPLTSMYTDSRTGPWRRWWRSPYRAAPPPGARSVRSVPS